MKVLLISLLLLTSCGGNKWGHIVRQGAIQGNTVELKVEEFCSIRATEIDLSQDFGLVEDTVYDAFTEITVGVQFDFTQEEALYLGNVLDALLGQLAKIKEKSNQSYIVSVGCMDGHDFRKMKSYGELKVLLKNDPFFEKLEKEGMAALSKDQLHKFQVDLTRVGIGRDK